MTTERQGHLFDLDEAGDPEVARSLLDQLLADAKLYTTSDSYKELLDAVVRLRNVAPFNGMLLQLQKPKVTYVASAYDWKTRLNRLVKEDARPLLILWPFGPVATVYDVLDTYDPKNPSAEGPPAYLASFLAAGPITKERVLSFEGLLRKTNIELRWVDRGDASAGEIRVVNPATKGEPIGYVVKLNRNHTPAVQFSTLAHELAHLCLGHLGQNRKLKIPSRRALRRSEVEIEAESVAYLVSERNGIRVESQSYLSHFVESGIGVDRLDLYQIMRAAGQVEKLLELTAHTQFDRHKRGGSGKTE